MAGDYRSVMPSWERNGWRQMIGKETNDWETHDWETNDERTDQKKHPSWETNCLETNDYDWEILTRTQITGRSTRGTQAGKPMAKKQRETGPEALKTRRPFRGKPEPRQRSQVSVASLLGHHQIPTDQGHNAQNLSSEEPFKTPSFQLEVLVDVPSAENAESREFTSNRKCRNEK